MAVRVDTNRFACGSFYLYMNRTLVLKPPLLLCPDIYRNKTEANHFLTIYCRVPKVCSMFLTRSCMLQVCIYVLLRSSINLHSIIVLLLLEERSCNSSSEEFFQLKTCTMLVSCTFNCCKNTKNTDLTAS